MADEDYSDLEDDGVLDASDTLEGNPGEDPLDTGVIPADRWSAGMRFGSTAEEEEEGESLDQLLSEEEPDITDDDDPADGITPNGSDPNRSAPNGSNADGNDSDEDIAEEDLDGLLLDDGPDPRAGRLVAEDEGAHPDREADLVARDAGIDGGAASAEEAAVHVVDDDDYDIRSGD
jgi:hypothetical protein